MGLFNIFNNKNAVTFQEPKVSEEKAKEVEDIQSGSLKQAKSEKQSYLSLQKKSLEALRKQLRSKEKELEESWAQSNAEKIKLIQERFSLVSKTGVLKDICYILKETWHWKSWSENEQSDWNFSEYISQFVFNTSYESGRKKNFESYLGHGFNEIHISEGELQTSIGIKEPNIELLLYSTGFSHYDRENEFGEIEVLKDGNLVLEFSCIRTTYEDDYDEWESNTISYATDLDWIQSVKEFKEHLIHQKNLEKLEGDTSESDFLIKRHQA